MDTNKERPRPGFVKVKCPDCQNEQPVFTKANIAPQCSICGATLATPTGGKAALRAEVVGELE
jgi:small subunit ribosomal protein S27e